MKVSQTSLKGCFIIEPQVFPDKRGYFFESYNQSAFKQVLGADIDFVQDNESYSSKGVLRGLHYQKDEFAQAKLVRVIKGQVLDVAVDLRKNSETFGKHVSVLLSGKNKKQFFVPRGFAHGFVVLSETALFSYKCDNFYNKQAEGGILFSDPALGINWSLPDNELIISEKDLILPTLQKANL